MGNLPLVSIITGYYNRKDNLKESIQSVLDQTYPNFEYIIFDDCSTDGTYELISSFNDPRLRIIRHHKNIGFTKGIIAAIAESKGELIAIHGAGDISFKERISKQVDLLQRNPQMAIVGCVIEDISKEGTVIQSPQNKKNKIRFTQGEVMYPKKLYYLTGGYNSIFKYGQFTNLQSELSKYGTSGYVDEVLYRRIHFSNGVTKNPKRRVEQLFYMSLGKEIAKKENFLKLDISEVIIKTSVYDLLDQIEGTEQEELLIYHLRKRSFLLYSLYLFYKKNFLSKKNLKNSVHRFFKR